MWQTNVQLRGTKDKFHLYELECFISWLDKNKISSPLTEKELVILSKMFLGQQNLPKQSDIFGFERVPGLLAVFRLISLSFLSADSSRSCAISLYIAKCEDTTLYVSLSPGQKRLR